jgi:arylsulfatase
LVPAGPYNLFQYPYERAVITSNTYRDWLINHVGGVYGTMDDVMKFAATLKEFPPRSIPPSYSASTILEETINRVVLK